MSERMTPAKVVAELRVRDRYYRRDENNPLKLGIATACRAAADLVEQHLAPQVLDEPDGAGDYWIEGVTAVCRVMYSDKASQWMYYDKFGWEPLSGRRVAKVPPGPFAQEVTQ